MIHQGNPIWPPRWNKVKANVATVVGEVGMLKFVHAPSTGALKCYMVIEHDGEQHVGELVFDDRSFAERIVLLLKDNLGRAIKDIGDIDLAF